MPAPIHRTFSVVAEYVKAMGEIQTEFLKDEFNKISRHEELADETSGVLKQQACVMAIFGALGAACTCLSAFNNPSTPNPATTAPSDPRVNANEGLGDMISNAVKAVGEKITDKAFTDGGAKLCDTISRAADPYYRAQTTLLNSQQELTKMIIQEDQGNKTQCDSNVRTAHDKVSSIQQVKSRNG